MGKKARNRALTGDVFRVPISSQSSGFGQILANYENEMLLVVIFDTQAENSVLPSLQTITSANQLFIANTLDAKIWHGEWPIVGNVMRDPSSVPLPKYKVRIGDVLYVESYDGLRKRPATDREEAILAYRKCVYPQILEDALKDHFGTFDKSKFSGDQFVRLRNEFESLRADKALQASNLVI